MWIGFSEVCGKAIYLHLSVFTYIKRLCISLFSFIYILSPDHLSFSILSRTLLLHKLRMEDMASLWNYQEVGHYYFSYFIAVLCILMFFSAFSWLAFKVYCFEYSLDIVQFNPMEVMILIPLSLYFLVCY